MTERDDHQLLAEFARENSETAFAALVGRHINLVYATALRSVGNTHAAEEIAQAVFIILAQKAGKLSARVVVSGWLYQTTRLTAANYLRGEIRRQQREQEAYMQSILNEPDTTDAWRQIAPLLDGALEKLGDQDRNAVVLRFLENKSLMEVGMALGASEDAAKMRVNRALEKLQKIFCKRGVTLSAALIAGSVSINSAQAAPAGLAATISTVAITKGAAAGGSTLALVKGALKLMAWMKAKMAITVGMGVLLAAGTATVVVEKTVHSKLSSTDLSWADDPKYWEQNSMAFDQLPPVFIFRPTQLPYGGTMMMRSSKSQYDKHMGRQCDVKWLMADAYGGYSQPRCVFPPDMPIGSYDFMFTLPEDFHVKLKAELYSRFGLTAHVEKRVVNVLLLKVKTPNATGLKVTTSNASSWIGRQYGAKIHGQKISNLIGWLEMSLNQPVMERTGLTNNYDLDLDWQTRPGQSETDAIKQMLLDQLGLALVPSREPVEMLVVEKVK